MGLNAAKAGADAAASGVFEFGSSLLLRPGGRVFVVEFGRVVAPLVPEGTGGPGSPFFLSS